MPDGESGYWSWRPEPDVELLVDKEQPLATAQCAVFADRDQW